jgi:hypothetical protein
MKETEGSNMMTENKTLLDVYSAPVSGTFKDPVRVTEY